MAGVSVIVLENEKEVAQKAAAMIVSEISRKKNAVMGFATGKTMIPIYLELVKLYKNGVVDFSEVTSFNLDEYVGFDESDKNSLRSFMEKRLFSKVGMIEEQVHFLDGKAENLDAECVKYEAEIFEAGGIDFQMLGLGRNGHIAFEEPGSSLRSRTGGVELSLNTRKANAGDFGAVGHTPRFALSMGLGTILESRKILLVVTGKHKAEAVRNMLKNRISKSCPASVLRRHNDVTVLLDREAASKL